MPEPVVQTEEKKEEKPQILQDREKSFSQIIQEQRNEVQDPTPEAPIEEPDEAKKEEERLAQEAQEAKAKVESDEAEKKRVAELAATAATEVIKQQEQARKAETDRIKAEEAEKARQEALKPKFSAVDKDGNPIPSTYEETSLEGARIGEERAVERIRKELAEKEAATKAEQEKQIAAQKQQEEARTAYKENLAKQLGSEEEDLYKRNLLTKIKSKDPNDESDLGVKEKNELYKMAQKVNAERIAKGEPVIASIKLIYYDYYMPEREKILARLQNVPGHDAPVMGNEPIGSQPVEDSKYNVARDRGKSVSQILSEEARKMTRRLGVRGA